MTHSGRYDDHPGSRRLGEAAAEVQSAGFSGSRAPDRTRMDSGSRPASGGRPAGAGRMARCMAKLVVGPSSRDAMWHGLATFASKRSSAADGQGTWWRPGGEGRRNGGEVLFFVTLGTDLVYSQEVLCGKEAAQLVPRGTFRDSYRRPVGAFPHTFDAGPESHS